ncbi:hypothetical protein [Actinomadura sp. 9N407]|uniref:hypothetical protein n=1 Tax=Actinomadura sp. 9N407 TaxID=3375154 RepID=UPI0037885A96
MNPNGKSAAATIGRVSPHIRLADQSLDGVPLLVKAAARLLDGRLLLPGFSRLTA